ncbi:MAG: DUF721 domain-containing protein [Verrucomicrobiota bacterium]|nr:DUF721 domain-containing protein [Verrucomicrobiota bacterium]
MPKRRSSFHRGRWEAQRERLRIEGREPPAAFVEFRRIGEILPGIMKRLGLENKQWLLTLEAEWGPLVGAAVARHTRPGRLERRRLTVFVDSPVWRNELERFTGSEMLGKLQARFGRNRIESVSLQLDPDGGQPAGNVR